MKYEISLVAKTVKNPPAVRRPRFSSWEGKTCWRTDRLPTPVFWPGEFHGQSWTQLSDFHFHTFHISLLGFPGGSNGKESTCSAGDLVLIPGFERSPRGGHGNPFQYSFLEHPQGQRSLLGYSSCAHRGSDMTKQLSTHSMSPFYTP